MTGMPAATAGLLAYTMAVLLAGRLVGLRLAAIAILAGLGWIPYLLLHYPYLGGTVALAVGWLGVYRYGWRHLLLWFGLLGLFATMLWGRVTTGGWDLGAALGDAAGRTLRFAVGVAVAWWAWRLVKERISYVTHPLAWNAESRRVQQLAEHRIAKGRIRKGLGWAGGKTRDLVTRRDPKPLPAAPSPDQADHAPLDAAQITAEPLFANREPWWKVRP